MRNPGDARVDSFVEWNLRLLQAFFSPASQGDEVWLAIDPDELDAIGPDLGGDSGFLMAVRRGPPWPALRGGRDHFVRAGNAGDFADRALGLVAQRQTSIVRPAGYVDPGMLSEDYREQDAPTYLPFVAALIRCSATQDEHGYYAGLRGSLQLPPSWYTLDMARMDALWSDLARWSGERGSLFGRFVFRQLGGYRYVGVPRSQSIISRRDASALTRVFAQAGVRPGQAVTDQLLNDIHRDAAGADFLSAPFRVALASDDFAVPVRERLRALLDDWDGVIINAAHNRAGAGQQGPAESLEDHIEVALSLGPGNCLPWQVRWRVPALRDSGLASITVDSACWTAVLAGTEVVTTGDDILGELQPLARQVLARTEHEDVNFEVSLQEDESAPSLPLGELVLRSTILRSFVAEREDGGGSSQVVLSERPLPAYGGAYLLAVASNVLRLQDFLRRNGVAHEECPAEGLPDEWNLIYLPQCAQLGDSVRNELPDGEAARSRPRIVRLVGGRPIQRAGLRQYLAYDLPSVELDAPPGAQLRAPGLVLSERGIVGSGGGELQGQGPIGTLSGLRRFDIAVPEGAVRSFLIEAIYEGQVIGTARLRLAPGSGLQAHVGQGFSLDRQGNPRGDNVGLLGALLCSSDAPAMGSVPTIIAHLGVRIGEGDWSQVAQHPAARFLDSLAQCQSGSMPYGTARDQLRRLARSDGQDHGDETLAIVTELRSRGFLEIESDAKGHWVRVHAAPPVLFTLPVTTNDGWYVLGVAGTLRQQHWEELCRITRHGGTVHLGGNRGSSLLPTVHVSVPSLELLHEVTTGAGFALAEDPASTIACWAACLDDVREGLEEAGVESLGSAATAVERYVPASGQFTPSRQGTSLDPEPRRQLLRLQDAETGRHQIYTLGFHDADGRPRYSFVRDSRWGVWLALVAFAQYVRDCHGVADASPWPFEYCRREHTLWLPARINLPAVLERALVLCSGDRPVRVQVHGRLDRGVIYLEPKDGGRPIGSVSGVYDEFAPRHPGWATWLGYRWVPEGLAGLVAEKLGGSLHYVAR